MSYLATLPACADAPFTESIVSIDALKCLSNMLLLDAEMRSLLVSLKVLDLAVSAIKTQNLSIGASFLLSRIVFLGTVGNKASILSVVGNGVCDALAMHLSRISTGAVQLQPHESWINKDLAINEIMKAAFNLAVPIAEAAFEKAGPTGIFGLAAAAAAKPARPDPIISSSPERQQSAQQYRNLLAAIIQIYMTAPLAAGMPLVAPHSSAINFMMNFPVTSLVDTWFPKSDY
eukprot:jgi/Hompol1/4308/HPOL_007036-RA